MKSTVYNASPSTGEFIGESPANKSPREPGVFILPGSASFTPPPVVGDHEVAVLVGQRWEVKPDWREVGLYAKANGESVVTLDIGVTPDDLAATPLSRPTDYHLFDEGTKTWLEDAALKATMDAAFKAKLVADTDAQVASVYSSLTSFDLEYKHRAPAALAFKANDYKGDPGPWIKPYMEASGKGARAATDFILVKAMAYNEAVATIAALRARKSLIPKAKTRVEASNISADIVAQVLAAAQAL